MYPNPQDDGVAPRRRIPAALRTAAGVLAVLVAAGAALGPLADDASHAARPAGVAGKGEFTREMAGEGLLVASLGGMRTLLADAFWLRSYVMWVRQDRAACTLFARTACALAPETPYFREVYANRMAFDFPHWAVRERGGVFRVPEVEQAAVHRREALAAIAYLDKEMVRYPDEPRLPLVAGEIADIKLRDRARAAAYYRRSAESPSGPWYPAMLYTNYLEESGRVREAAEWLHRYAHSRPEGSASRLIALDRLKGLPAPE